MTRDLFHFITALAGASTFQLEGFLVRRVPLGDLVKSSPTNFLFASGRPNRYNPAGVECIYFAADEETARMEYERYWGGLQSKQPFVTYFAEVRLRRVLDLLSARILEQLGLEPGDLYRPWRGAQSPTVTQLLGQAISMGSPVSAIRYPSDAARASGHPGANVVVFRNQLKPSDSLIILGPDKQPLQEWP